MRRYAFILLFAVASVVARGETLPDEGAELVPGRDEAEWTSLFNELGSKESVRSAFTEHRWFPFKKIPVVLKGVMRSSRTLGVSLHYTEPEVRTVVIDTRGILLRDASGKQREVPADPRAPAASSALLPVLQFDREQLAQSFIVRGSRAGDGWRLDFIPRDPQLAGTIGRIIARGEGLLLTQLEFRRSAMQRVEILIGETETNISFPPEEQRRYFR